MKTGYGNGIQEQNKGQDEEGYRHRNTDSVLTSYIIRHVKYGNKIHENDHW